MGDHQQWIKIDEVVASYLDRSEQGVHKYYKIYHIAFDGMKQLGLDFFYTVKSLKLPVNGNLTVTLPDDFLQYTKVGVFNDQSEVIPLMYNSKLTFFQDQLSTRQQSTEDPTLGDISTGFPGFNFYNYWDGMSFFGTVYGAPSGAPFVGTFKIDHDAGIILLDENFYYDYLVLEYIASPQPEQGTYYLPFQFKEALIAYIGWQDMQYLPNSRRGAYNDKMMQRKNFFLERRLAIARYKPLRMDDYYEEQLRAQRLTVKA